MADCLFLLIDRLVRLIISYIQTVCAVLSGVLPSPSQLLFIEVIRILPPLFQEISRHVLIFLFSCNMIELHQANLYLLMTRESMLFLLLRSEPPNNVICQSLCHVQQLILPGHAVIRRSRLHHVACTIQLMTFLKILPAMLRFLDDKIRIQVPIRLLCFFDDLNHLVCPCLQRRIRLDCQRICHAFQPLRHITVLKHHSIELSLT